MKRTLAAVSLLVLATGCGTNDAQDQSTADNAADIEAGCAEVVANEYEPDQRPPTLDIQDIEQDDGVYTLRGTSLGDTTYPALYEFECRHSGGVTVLASFERSEDDAPAPGSTGAPDPAFDEFADSLTDEQYDTLIDGLGAYTAELKCQAAAGRDYVPADQKPYSSEIEPPIPYRGGYLVAGKILGANGMVAVLGCEVDSDNNAKVVRFDIAE